MTYSFLENKDEKETINDLNHYSYNQNRINLRIKINQLKFFC
jgi:hypothetical protein